MLQQIYPSHASDNASLIRPTALPTSEGFCKSIYSPRGPFGPAMLHRYGYMSAHRQSHEISNTSAASSRATTAKVAWERARHSVFAIGRQSAILLLALATTGCGLIPRTSQELLASSHKSESYCYNDSADVVAERVRQYLHRCYQPHTTLMSAPVGGAIILLPSTVMWRVEEERSGEDVQISIAGRYGYPLSAVIRPERNNCHASMQVFGGNGFWENRFEMLNNVAKGVETECNT